MRSFIQLYSQFIFGGNCMSETENIYIQSNLYVENREKLRLTGVTDVDNFDDYNISVKTQKGDLSIGGENLKISKLDVENGELHVEGLLHSLFYTDNAVQKNSGVFGKLFK